MDCSLKFDYMKKELLVIVSNHITVNLTWRIRKSHRWDQLSNSGDTLELQVPSYIRKDIGGWTNHSCTVITLKTSEKKMSNRGSNSEFKLDHDRNIMLNSVKEQRVDDSCRVTNTRLRYTLRDLTPLKVLMENKMKFSRLNLSNRDIQLRSYSSSSLTIKETLTEKNSTSVLNNNQTLLINPYFITGFIHAEGSFVVTVRENTNFTTYTVETRFSIGLHSKDLPLLKSDKNVFWRNRYHS